MVKEERSIGRYLDIVMGVEGQISRNEAETLMMLTKKVEPGNAIVEVGSFRGRSTVALGFGSIMHNNNRVYAVDPHVEFTGVLGGKFGIDDQDELYKNIVRSGVGKIVAVVSIPSVKAAQGWSDKNIGLLWIDGDHRYESVKADYGAWAPHVVDDGVIAFHDCNLEGIATLIRETTSKGEIKPLGTIENLAWFIK